MVAEKAGTETEIVRVDMVVDQEISMIHVRDPTKAMGMTRILVRYEDIRNSSTFGFVLWWVSRVFSLSFLFHQG